MIWMKINITMEMITKSNKFSLLYVLYPKEDIQNIHFQIKSLLKKKWIVCANILPPLNSFYLWKNKQGKEEICNEKEVMVFFKTGANKMKDVKKYLVSKHPYDIPCVVELNADVNQEYLGYLNTYLS